MIKLKSLLKENQPIVDVNDIQFLYHVTPSINVGYIKNQGLIPTAGNKLEIHEPVVYFVTSDISAWSMAFQLNKILNKKGKSLDFTILKIDIKKLPQTVIFYKDKSSLREAGIFTYESIPPNCIEIYEEIKSNQLLSKNYVKEKLKRFYPSDFKHRYPNLSETHTGQDKLDNFINSLSKYGLEYHGTDSPDAFKWRNSIYPTITNKEKTVKVGLDRTDIFDRNGDVWVGDPSHPLLNGWVIGAIVTDPEHRGKGEASKVLQQIVKAADECGIMFKGEPVAMKDFIKKGQKSLTRNQLIKWYQRHGFEPNERGNIITRNPKKVDEASMNRTPEEREKAIQDWLDDKISKAPGKDRGEKLEWLHANDPQYKKVVNVLVNRKPKFRKYSWDIHPDAYKASFRDDRYFIRFGDLPSSGKSMNHLVKRHEKGISMYPAKWNIQKNMWELDTSSLSEIGIGTLDSLINDYHEGKGRPVYLVYGRGTTETGMDDDEPLVNKDEVKIVKKLNPNEVWIDEFGGNEWAI